MAQPSANRLDTDGRDYYRRKLAEDKKSHEAIRCLKPRISDAIYRQLLEDVRRLDGADGGTGPGGHCRATQEIQRGRPSLAHPRFGSATSRTRKTDAASALRSARNRLVAGILTHRASPSGHYVESLPIIIGDTRVIQTAV